MDKLSSLLPAALKRRGLYDEVSASVIITRATEWLSERLPLHRATLRVVSFVNGVLSIEVEHSIALQECAAYEKMLINALAEAFPGTQIREMRVRRAQ